MPSPRKREVSDQCSCQGGPASCGKNSTYQRHKCGCDPCVASQRERVNANAAARRERAAATPDETAGVPARIDATVTPSASAKSTEKRNARPATLDFGPQTVPASQVWRPPGWKPLDRDYKVADKKGRKR